MKSLKILEFWDLLYEIPNRKKRIETVTDKAVLSNLQMPCPKSGCPSASYNEEIDRNLVISWRKELLKYFHLKGCGEK